MTLAGAIFLLTSAHSHAAPWTKVKVPHLHPEEAIAEIGDSIHRENRAMVNRFKSGATVRKEVRALRAKNPNLRSELRAQAADPHIKNVLEYSQKGGSYHIVSDLHMGFGRSRPGAGFNRQEDFKRTDAWVKTMEYLGKQPKPTLVIGGDFLDLLEHVNPEAGLDEVKNAISQMVTAHASEFRTLAQTVVHKDLRVVYLRGNHDIRLMDSSQGDKGVRAHFMDQITEIAKLTPSEKQLFKERVAYSGAIAPLGQHGEVMVVHNEHTDPTNSWRSPMNPFSYTASGERVIPRSFGDNVVRHLWVEVENQDPDADNREKPATKTIAQQLLVSRKAQAKAADLLWDAARPRLETSPAQQLAERIDDRQAFVDWVKLTGFAEMQNRPLDPKATPGKRSPEEYAKLLEGGFRLMPTPIHERMTSNWHLTNAAKMLFGGAHRALDQANRAEPKFLEYVTKQLPNVKWVVGGHDHDERIRTGDILGKGQVGFYDSGTWTKVDGEDRLNMVVIRTDQKGVINPVLTDEHGEEHGNPDLFRVNPTTGEPEFPPSAAHESHDKVNNWNNYH